MLTIISLYLLSPGDLDKFDAEAKSPEAGVGWLLVHTPPGQGGHC